MHMSPSERYGVLRARSRRAVRGDPFAPFKNYDNEVFVGTIGIGTPYQGPFYVVFDTVREICVGGLLWFLLTVETQGSSNLWVPQTGCNSGGCAGKNHYNAQQSSTYVANGQTFSIQYGTGSCSGTLVNDTVCVTGPRCVINSPLSVKGVTFGQASQMADFFAQTPIDGILGLGFQSLAEDNVVPVFNMMVQENLVPKAQFQIFLDSKPFTNNAAIVFGGYNPQFFTGSLRWVPLTSENYYVIQLYVFRGVYFCVYASPQMYYFQERRYRWLAKSEPVCAWMLRHCRQWNLFVGRTFSVCRSGHQHYRNGQPRLQVSLLIEPENIGRY
jgi:hypothetical protein